MNSIHPSAVVSLKAELGNNITIGPFCVIDDDVVIDDGNKIYNNVSILSGARIGKNNQIYPGAVISANPQDLKYAGEYTQTFIGDNNKIRECVTINKGTVESGKTIVGNNTLFMAYSHAAHDCIIGNDVVIANSVAIAGHCHIDDHVTIGGISGIHQFVKIGKHCMIGATSYVAKDIPPFTLFAGSPCSFAGINLTGLRRRGFSSNQIDQIKSYYKTIYDSGLNFTQSLQALKELPSDENLIEIINFIENSSRGISR